MRVLVCGGRDYADRECVFGALDGLHNGRAVACVIHGAASGADSLAGEWARQRGVPEVRCPADWRAHGRAAGPIRNSAMLREHSPDIVVAFPGGRGTADMAAKAQATGVRVWRPTEDAA